jgi:hypothetical protein
MSTSIDKAFIKQFESEVHMAYQDHGFKLREFVRVKAGIVGSSTTFQKSGKGTATSKSRHGVIPPMNADHTPVECVLADYYAGDWVDKFDELKTNVDERMVVAKTAAYAIGRKSDNLIITALDATTNTISVNRSAITQTVLSDMITRLGERDVPVDDGQLAAVVSFSVWGKLLTLDEFASADFVGDDLPYAKAVGARNWLGAVWMPHTGLTKTGNDRKCYMFHKTGVGLASGQDIVVETQYYADRASTWVHAAMSQGAVVIDGSAVEEFIVNEAA